MHIIGAKERQTTGYGDRGLKDYKPQVTHPYQLQTDLQAIFYG
jgi:hypothetical protein